MKRFIRCATAAFLTLILSAHAPIAFALQITFSDTSNPPFTIADNDTNDGDITLGIIDYTLDGSQVPGLEGEGIVEEFVGAIGRVIKLAGTEPGPSAVVRNATAADMDVEVTVESSAYAAIGSPLGWRLYYEGAIADITPDNVDVTGNQVELSVNGGTLLTTAVVGGTQDYGDPPIPFVALGASGSNTSLDATSSELFLTATLGPSDEIQVAADPVGEELVVRGHVFNQAARCIFKTNVDGSKVATLESKGNLLCVKALIGIGGDATACVNTITSGTAAAGLATRHAVNCDPLPAWGVDADPALISGAAQTAAADVTHDLLGQTVLVSSDILAGKCQYKVMAALTKGLGKAWKTFAKCKKFNFFSITDDASLESTCLPDANLSVQLAATQAKVQDYATDCDLYGVLLPAFDNGRCDDIPAPATFATCAASRLRCRLCQALNVADDIDSPGFDCDGFDDGVANASCSNLSGATTTTSTTVTTTTSSTTTT